MRNITHFLLLKHSLVTDVDLKPPRQWIQLKHINLEYFAPRPASLEYNSSHILLFYDPHKIKKKRRNGSGKDEFEFAAFLVSNKYNL